MRKISSKYELQKAQKRNQWVIGGVLIFLMLASTLGFAFQGGFGSGNIDNGGNVITYNGFQFENINGFWVLGNFVFRYNPGQISDLETSLESLDSYREKPLHIYSESPQAESEIRVNLGQFTGGIENADSENARDCSDNFIIIKEDTISKIEQSSGCVFIHGRNQAELVENADLFLFKIFGIVE